MFDYEHIKQAMMESARARYQEKFDALLERFSGTEDLEAVRDALRSELFESFDEETVDTYARALASGQRIVLEVTDVDPDAST